MATSIYTSIANGRSYYFLCEHADISRRRPNEDNEESEERDFLMWESENPINQSWGKKMTKNTLVQV